MVGSFVRLLVGALAVLLSGCARAPDAKTQDVRTAQTAAPPQVPPQFVRLRGSSTVGASLAPALAEAFLRSRGATNIGVRTDDKRENYVTVSGIVGGKYSMFQIHYPGTREGFQGLAAGECDVAMASRPIEDDEVAKLHALGDMTSADAEHVVAMDGIAIVVNPSNPVSSLTVDQIGSLFRGDVKDWSQVGGRAGAVHRYIRDKRSGTYDSFVHLALGGSDIPALGATVLDDAESVAAAVAKDPQGIGFVGLPSVGSTKPLLVEDGEAVPLGPTPDSVKSEEYAFSRRLFLYTAERAASPLAKDFVEFALSDEGQKVVAQAGFVSLAATSAPVTVARKGAPETYVRETSGAQRLSFSFRFRGNDLDARSVRDLDRMSRFIKVASSSHRDVSLFGFSDPQATSAKSVAASQKRAEKVAEKLRERGIEARVVEGLGDAMPVAPNSTPRGRQKNRRVEVWLR
jgi:phosphate transport system substrate-binding protein